MSVTAENDTKYALPICPHSSIVRAMKTRIPYLSETEQLVAEMVADGKSYLAISRQIPHLSERQVAHVRASLCRKAGIPNTKDPQPAQEYLRNVEQALKTRPDADQFSLLAEIAIKGPPFMNDCTIDALRSAGIFTLNPKEAHLQCRAFVIASGKLPVIDSTTKEALQLYGDGCPLDEIARLIEDDKVLKRIRDGCKALGITSRGKGVQRRLIRMILERLNVVQERDKPAEKDPLDDY